LGCATLVVATVVGCRPAPQTPGAPAPADTPARRALAAWLSTYNANDPDSLIAFARRAYAPSELASRPPEVIARGHRLWRKNYGTFELLRIDSAAAYSIDGFVRQQLTDAIGKVYVEVDSQPPHGITGVYLLPFTRPPADLATRAVRADAEIVSALAAYAARLSEADVFSGSVVLQRRDSILFARAYGHKRRDASVPNTPDTASNSRR
jgi:hypothetical protein